MNREKIFGFMMDMCCTGMPDEEKQKMKDMCKNMAGQFPACCRNKDVSSFMKQCFSGPEPDKPQN